MESVKRQPGTAGPRPRFMPKDDPGDYERKRNVINELGTNPFRSPLYFPRVTRPLDLGWWHEDRGPPY